MKQFVCAMLFCLIFGGCDSSRAPADRSASNQLPNSPAAERDNTAVNVRDRAETAKTPIDQNENKKDVNITADIRKRVVDEKMSTDAHNVKIITQDGKVTLRGPVKSADEKKRIEEIAQDVAGAGNIDSQLEVAEKR